MAVIDDLVAEQDRLETILARLRESDWAMPSAAAGWSVADVVLHLAQTEEAVVASAAGQDLTLPPALAADVARQSVDEVMNQWVMAERAAPAVVFGRWRKARLAASAALRAADPRVRLAWVERSLRPVTLATTRLAEHWAHGLDITGPLGIEFPDTARLRHVAWLAHRSLPYALALAGEPSAEVSCELTAPDGGGVWRFGPQGADTVITGPAGAFCRVAAQRLSPGQSGLTARGRLAILVLRALRTYAA